MSPIAPAVSSEEVCVRTQYRGLGKNEAPRCLQWQTVTSDFTAPVAIEVHEMLFSNKRGERYPTVVGQVLFTKDYTVPFCK